ncbi:hypothetical protein SKP52_07975 [Sphingopyxis fribergensis]|uniref:FecR protein domain-containing protein n=1 Tax=Sphingopyxis fribergensis TaxID=1515612 RepID=A0A0A7PEV8_9SPHN|nr:FecR domain-containing protein [Sphingopyxis fribergensis]AJA08514.1 hypothetical protein SKP52_07975 [Sphingopyxis fribergensis]
MAETAPRKTFETLRDEALGWIIRLREGDATDWQAFEQWMAGDPRAADIYWDLAADDADVADALLQDRPIVPTAAQPARTAKAMWLGGGVLALAASLLLLLFLPGPTVTYSVETAPGQTRSIPLSDGSEILLNGGSKIQLDRENPRRARLADGEGRFTIAHDETRPFIVEVGEASLTDLGTVFSVTRQGGELRVAVAEGAVRYSRGGISRDLAAGDTLRIGRDGRLVAGEIEPADVAAWADGRLAYGSVDVAAVAADLSRATGLDVSADPAVARRPFSGGFALGKRDAETVRRAASLMGLRIRAKGKGWILEAPASGLE